MYRGAVGGSAATALPFKMEAWSGCRPYTNSEPRSNFYTPINMMVLNTRTPSTDNRGLADRPQLTVALLAALTLALGACARSGGVPVSVQPERPTVATHAGTVAPGLLEIETGIERDRNPDRRYATQAPTVLKFGVTKETQLSISTPFLNGPGTAFGPGDFAIGVKWRVLHGAPILNDFALLPQIKFPTGGDRSTKTADATLLLISSRLLGPVAVDVNAGATWRSGDGSNAPRTATAWTVSAGMPVHRALGWVVEVFGYPRTSGPAANPGTAALLTGPTYLVRPQLALDAGIITPISGPLPHAFYVGMVANVGQLIPR